jgi:hypothetical protein
MLTSAIPALQHRPSYLKGVRAIQTHRPPVILRPSTTSTTTEPTAATSRRMPLPSTSLLDGDVDSGRYGQSNSAERRMEWTEWDARGGSGLGTTRGLRNASAPPIPALLDARDASSAADEHRPF